MAECELRQRKKEEGGDDKLQPVNEEVKSVLQDKVQPENKPEPVRYRHFQFLSMVFIFCVIFYIL